MTTSVDPVSPGPVGIDQTSNDSRYKHYRDVAKSSYGVLTGIINTTGLIIGDHWRSIYGDTRYDTIMWVERELDSLRGHARTVLRVYRQDIQYVFLQNGIERGQRLGGEVAHAHRDVLGAMSGATKAIDHFALPGVGSGHCHENMTFALRMRLFDQLQSMRAATCAFVEATKPIDYSGIW